jgi:hypothetical protein
MTVDSLLKTPLQVVNIGLESFARDLAAADIPVVDLDWQPPARGDAGLARLLAKLDDVPAIEAANEEALKRLLAADPVLIDVQVAGDVLNGLEDRMIGHAGPPIAWPQMCGPLRGAIQGAIVLEGWAPDLEAADSLAASGGIKFVPNHHLGAVGPMTGMITRSMPVLVVENRTYGNRAYCTLNEGLGKVMRFGGNDADVLKRLRWLGSDLAPALAAALRASGGLGLKNIIARGLTMGDEMHQRNVACTSLFVRAMAPHLARAISDPAKLASVFEFIGGNDQFFLNVAMAMGKAIADPAKGIANATLVTAMCRNGTEFGIRVAATGERWFTAPVEQPTGLYFAGYSAADANPDIGDSAIVETVGLGGFAMAASPAVAGFVGAGSASDALDITRAMMDIAVGRNPDWTIPGLDFAGTPVGIDIRKVVETGIAPTINTGIAHKKPGIGQVGAGTVKAPLKCFDDALAAVAEMMGVA